MPRPRSSFEIERALETAASLATDAAPDAPSSSFAGVALVSFGSHATSPLVVDRDWEPPTARPTPVVPPPAVPDFGSEPGASARLRVLVAWISERTGVPAADVVLADFGGEALSGGAAPSWLAAVTRLVEAAGSLGEGFPGSGDSALALTVGAGPTLVVAGVAVRDGSCFAALRAKAPLSGSEIAEVRAVCESALAELPLAVLRAAAKGSTPPGPSAVEVARVRRLLAYVEAHAPEPHVIRLRLALRMGTSPLVLERPETLGPDAILLLETAVSDVLALDRSALRSLS